MFNFQPTFLYIKQHFITKKCYFGKTTCKDPVKYNGSGKHWKRHIKKHGIKFVETLWYKLFTDQVECTRVALLFSEQQDIVKSELWLNQIPENGIDGGGVKGLKHTSEARAKMMGNKNALGSKSSLGNKNALGHKNLSGFKHTPETRAKMKEYKHLRIVCPHCKLEGANNGMKRWHFNNCKKILNKEI